MKVDRPLAAAHEAGHLVVARHFKLVGCGFVMDEAPIGDAAGMALIFGGKNLPANHRRAIGMGGLVGEYMHHGRLDPAALSDPDREFCGPMTGKQIETAVQTARAILLARQGAWRKEVARILAR